MAPAAFRLRSGVAVIGSSTAPQKLADERLVIFCGQEAAWSFRYLILQALGADISRGYNRVYPERDVFTAQAFNAPSPPANRRPCACFRSEHHALARPSLHADRRSAADELPARARCCR